MTKKIKSEGSQLFNVPNDEQGKAWLKLMHQYRNANSPATLIHHAEWIAVYLDTSNKFQRLDNLWREANGAKQRLKELEPEAELLRTINAELEQENLVFSEILKENKVLLHDAYCKRIMNVIHGREVTDLFTILKTITK